MLKLYLPHSDDVSSINSLRGIEIWPPWDPAFHEGQQRLSERNSGSLAAFAGISDAEEAGRIRPTLAV